MRVNWRVTRNLGIVPNTRATECGQPLSAPAGADSSTLKPDAPGMR